MNMQPISPPISLEEFKRKRRPHHNVRRQVHDKLSPLNKLAVWVTARVGTMGFFLLIFAWTLFWLGWNFLAPKALQFDPPMSFVFWLFISNVIQILLMPLIMVGQNVQGAHEDARAEHDLEVNMKAEEEIEVVLAHLEYQNTILLSMMEKLSAEAKVPTPRSRPA